MLKRLLFPLVIGCLLAAASPPAAKVPAPPLLPGESLALALTPEDEDKEVYLFGDTQRESPMGNLAYLPWLQLAGAEWVAVHPTFKCTGVMNGEACALAKGHGRVNLGSAIAGGCDLAILTWARMSAKGWKEKTDYGEGVARARMMEVFRPFLGNRTPVGDHLPVLDGPWVGDGHLLRTSPAELLTWLTDGDQEQLQRDLRRLFMNEFQEAYQKDAFWCLLATAEVPSEPGTYSSWAVGGNPKGVAVLRLPPGRSRADALARFQALIMVPRK